jgi:hypothetical protein
MNQGEWFEVGEHCKWKVVSTGNGGYDIVGPNGHLLARCFSDSDAAASHARTLMKLSGIEQLFLENGGPDWLREQFNPSSSPA